MKIIKYILAPLYLSRDILKLFIIYLPGTLGFSLRYYYYQQRFKKIGKNVKIDVGVCIDGCRLISVGNNVCIDKYCIIATGENLLGKVSKKANNDFTSDQGEIVIGNDIHIAQSCILMGYGGLRIDDNCVMSAGSKIYTLTNTPVDSARPGEVISIMPYNQAPFLLSPIVIHSNVWLGISVIVMPSVTIGQNSFCVSNSLVMNSFPENSYISGQPATLLRNRFLKT